MIKIPINAYHMVLTALGLAALSSASAQHVFPSLEWERFYPSSACDFYSVMETDNGGYVLGGRIYDIAEELSQNDCILVRIGGDGEIEWEKVYGGPGHESIASVQQTSDGGYVFAASSSPPSGIDEPLQFGMEHAWVVRVDAEGNKIWEQSFGETEGGTAASIWQTMDQGYVLAGNRSGLFGGADGWLVRIDAEGNKQWERSFGGEGSDSLVSIKQTSDQGYVMAGNSHSPPSGNKEAPHFGGGDGWLIKVDSAGNKLWERSFGGTEGDLFFSFDDTADGGFILGGRSSSPPSGNKESPHFGGADYWVVKLDAEGDKQWERSYGTAALSEEVRVVRQTSDGGYVLGANETANGISQLIKIDSQGNPEWEKSFGNDDPVEAYTVEIYGLLQTEAGGQMVCGSFNYPNAGIPASGCVFGAWAAKLEKVVARAGEVVAWQAKAGMVLESTDDLNNEWQNDESEVLSIGPANAIILQPAGDQRYYRLRATVSSTGNPSLSLGGLLSWPTDRNQILEFASNKEGEWSAFSGDQGIIGETHYAIVPQNLRQHYFRARNSE